LIGLRQQCLELGINWIIDADIRKFFDSISWTHLRAVLQRRVNDGTLLRLIGMWMHVGVLEEGQVVRSEDGTPQGAPVSPILANIFLHAVVDEESPGDLDPLWLMNTLAALAVFMARSPGWTTGFAL
jgi:RNA-directed DNA polymerase